MLKNNKLVHRLSTEQKISLVLSGKLYQSSSVEGYTFPEFVLSNSPIEGQENFKSTIFPKHNELVKTWNRKLIEEVARIEGEENNILSKNPIFNFSAKLDKFDISDDPYLDGDFIFHYLKGLQSSLAMSCFEVLHENAPEQIQKEINEFPNRFVLRQENMDFVLVQNYSEMAEIQNDFGSQKVFFGKPSTKEEIVKLINHGVYINFFEGDYEDAMAYLKQAVDLGSNAYGRLLNKQIRQYDYDVLLDNGAAMPMVLLDEACDNYISLLLKIDENRKKSIAENKYVSEVNKLPFDYKKHNDVALEAARQSIVMLKNNYNVLPISSRRKVGVIGDAAQNYDYYSGMFSGRVPTIFQTPYHQSASNVSAAFSLIRNIRFLEQKKSAPFFMMIQLTLPR